MTVLAGMASSHHCGAVQSDGLQRVFAHGESSAGVKYTDASLDDHKIMCFFVTGGLGTCQPTELKNMYQ